MADLMNREAPAQAPPVAEADVALLEEWRQRHKNATRDRRRFEPVWQVCSSFVQNRQWIGWSREERRVVQLPNPDDRERVTVNVLTPYLWTVVGKLTQEDFRPDITFRKEDIEGQAYARQAARALEYAWDNELDADEAVLNGILTMAELGTSILWLKADPSYGPVLGERPVGPDGRLIVDKAKAQEYVSQMVEQGQVATMRPLREGRLCWEAVSPFEFLPPPGVSNPAKFPWVIFEQATSIDSIATSYGRQVASTLREEKLRTVDLIGQRQDFGPENGAAAGESGDLRGHVMLKTGYENPTPEYAMGRTFIWAGDVVLANKPALPFEVGGMGKAGWVPLRYHLTSGRFWGIGCVEPGIGPQKQRNRSRSQWIEMKDRAGLGRVYATKGSITQSTKPKGGVFELVEVLPGHELPKETQGVPPGAWLKEEVDQNDQDLDRVMGIRGDVLSSLPQGVSAYSAYALFAEQDDKRIGPIAKRNRLEVAKLVKTTVAGFKTYWLPNKQITFTGENDLADTLMFDASKLPAECLVKTSTSAPMPQSQAAEAQKIFDLFDRSIAAGQVLPLDWLYDSLRQGRALPLPSREAKVQQDKADLENHFIANAVKAMQGQLNPAMLPRVAPYDNDELHVMRHRNAQNAWQYVPGMELAVQAEELHIQEHMMSAQAKAAQQVQSQPTNPGGTPAKEAQGNGRDAGFGQQMLAAKQGVLPSQGAQGAGPPQGEG